MLRIFLGSFIIGAAYAGGIPYLSATYRTDHCFIVLNASTFAFGLIAYDAFSFHFSSSIFANRWPTEILLQLVSPVLVKKTSEVDRQTLSIASLPQYIVITNLTWPIYRIASQFSRGYRNLAAHLLDEGFFCKIYLDRYPNKIILPRPDFWTQ